MNQAIADALCAPSPDTCDTCLQPLSSSSINFASIEADDDHIPACLVHAAVV